MASAANSEDELIFEQVEPLVRRIVRWRLGTTASPQDQEDIVGDVLLELLGRLNAAKDPIADVPAYAAVTAHHGCDLFLRRRFPRRHRLSTRLRYLLETSPAYAIWEWESAWICGKAPQRGAMPQSNLAPGWEKNVSLPAGSGEPDAVAAIFAFLRAPIRFADLVSAVADLLNVRDQLRPVESALLPAQEHDIVARMDHRRHLERLWTEIGQLPQPQRVALLLNLRDEGGGCALTSLPATGVASMRQIAEMLSIEAMEIAALWPRLPLSDLEIAARLDISRQQVINLRKSARQRLARRFSGPQGLVI